MIIGPCLVIIIIAGCSFALNPQDVTTFLEGFSSTQPKNEKYSNVVYTTSSTTTPRSGRVTYVSSTTPYYSTAAPQSQRLIFDSSRNQNARLYATTAAPRRYAGSLYSTSARQVDVPRIEVVSSTAASPLNINPRATIQVPYVSQRQEVQAHIPAVQENTVVEEVVETQPEPVEVEKKINIVTPAVKKTIYEIRKPAIEKQFFDIEEKVVVRPAGTAVVELEGEGTKVKKEETIQDVGKEQIVPQISDCEDSYSTPRPVVAYNGESGLSTASTDYEDNKEDYVDYNDPQYGEPENLRVRPQSGRLTETEQVYSDLLSNKNSVTVNDGPTSPGERVISATPAPIESKPASQTVQTRRIVVNHPFETVQVVEQNEPQEKVQAVTITQKVEPARYRVSANLKTTSRLIQPPTALPVRVVEAPRATIVPVRIVEAPKRTVLPVRIVEAPKPTVLPVRIVESTTPTVRVVESPRPTILPVRIVEAPRKVVPVRIVEAQKTVVPVRIVEAPKATVLPVRVVEAPRTVVPLRLTAPSVQYVNRYAAASPSLASAALSSGYYGSSYPYSSAYTSGYPSYSSAYTSGYPSYSSAYSSGYPSYSSALTSGYPYSSALTSAYSGSSYPYSSALTSGYSGGYSSGLYGSSYSGALTSGSYGGYSSALTADDCGDGYYK